MISNFSPLVAVSVLVGSRNLNSSRRPSTTLDIKNKLQPPTHNKTFFALGGESPAWRCWMTALRVPSAGRPAGAAAAVAQEALSGCGLAGGSSQPWVCRLSLGIQWPSRQYRSWQDPASAERQNYQLRAWPATWREARPPETTKALHLCFSFCSKILLWIKRKEHPSFNYKNCLFYSVYAFAITKTNHRFHQERHV